MTLKAALLKCPVQLEVGMSVEEALVALDKNKISFAPVVTEKDQVTGIFYPELILQESLPTSLDVGDSGMTQTLLSAPGFSKRLKKTMMLVVRDIMAYNFNYVTLSDHKAEDALHLLNEMNLPLIVLESPDSNKLAGMVTASSLINAMLADS